MKRTSNPNFPRFSSTIVDKEIDEQAGARPVGWQKRFSALRAFVRRGLPFTSGIAAALLALLLYSILFPRPHQLTEAEVNASVAQALASATPPPAFSARVYQAIQPSLVLIQSKIQEDNGETEDVLGSGVVITDRGDILTSRHVVAEASEIRVTFADGTHSSAEVTAEQPENDIALLSASQLPEALVPATLGNPGALRIGDEAFAVGNPFGLYSSMSAGVISGFERSFKPPKSDQKLEGLIQIDAAVNPGNSGGPLLNRDGQVVGIVVGIVNPTRQEVFIGIGFAVPITVAASGAGLPPY
jgi:S1-C subfamily serine protease